MKYTITGGSDTGLFTIDPVTGVLSFIAPPDFENPADQDGDNTYDVIVTATDSSASPLTDTQTISILIQDPAGWYTTSASTEMSTYLHNDGDTQLEIAQNIGADINSTSSILTISAEQSGSSTLIDNTISDSCGQTKYEAYIIMYKDDQRVSTGYKRVPVSANMPQECYMKLHDPTATTNFRFAPGTKAQLREPSAQEKAEFGNSNMVIVDDVILEDNAITLGEI